MTAGGWGGVVAGAGVALALFLVAAPGLANASARAPNVRGRAVSLLPGMFPAIAVTVVAAARALSRPETLAPSVVMVAVLFGAGGLVADITGGRLWRGGLDVAGVVLVAECALALVAASAVVNRFSTVLAIAAVVVSAVFLLRAPWPPVTMGVAAIGAFLVLVVWLRDSELLATAAPAVGALAVLVPLDARGRLVPGAAAAGTMGATLGLVTGVHATTIGRGLFVVVAVALAAVPHILRRGIRAQRARRVVA